MKFYAEIAALLVVISMLLAWFGRRYARRLIKREGIRVDKFKLKSRHAAIDLEVFGSEDVVAAVKNYAREHHVSVEIARRQARLYLAEIVPKFNLLAYYRFGAPIARALLNFLYRVVVERKPIQDFNERAPKDAVVVYVINHRSNVDYILVAHMLFKFISLSYAVGEWARVWPLNHLFKWFGGYFVRRRYREPLYHAVLRSFVQTITRHGVTQGIFIEGGLSRDGAFLKPKLGMLDYLVTAKRDPEFRSPLFLMPTAVNYDRTLEDRHLTEELMGKQDRSTRSEKLRTTFSFLFKNSLRSMVKRFKRYGYAIVSFGEPILIDDFIREHPSLLSTDFEERKPALQLLATRVMAAISAALPPTPVCLAAAVFLRRGKTIPLSDAAIGAFIESLRKELGESVWLLREKRGEELWEAAKELLVLRRLVERVDGGWRWVPHEILLRDYYANSIRPFDEIAQRGWPDRVDGGRPPVEAAVTVEGLT